MAVSDRFKFEKATYYYPNNLEAEVLIFRWKPAYAIAIGVMILIGMITAFRAHNFIVLVMDLVFALLTMSSEDDNRCIWDHVHDVIMYSHNAQIWQNMKFAGGVQTFHVTKSKSRKDRANSKAVDKAIERDRKEREKEARQLHKAQNSRTVDQKLAGQLVLAVIAGIFCITVAGVAGLNVYKQKRAAAGAGIALDLTTDTLEWKSGDIDATTLVKANADATSVKADPATISTDNTGDFKVTYTVSTDKASKKFTETVSVKDTQLPEITLGNPTVNVALNSEFDPESNIVSVKDPVEGNLNFADSAGFGKYTIDSNVDTSVAGDYTVTVDAIDSNGNETSANYSVHVE